MADFRITVDSSDLTVAARDTDKLKLANERLENSLEPLINKEKQLRSAVDLVRQSVDLGVISHKEAKAAVQRLGTQYGKTSKEMRTMANSMGGLRKNTNRMNAMFQNAGYQVGDFAVQVQSGQNVLVAFSQQGAQLAGLLPGLTGAIAGVGLVVGSSLVRAFTEGNTAFKSFSELIEGAVESADDYVDALRGVKEAIDLELGPQIVEFARTKVRKELGDTIDQAQASIEGLSKGGFFKRGLEQRIRDLNSELTRLQTSVIYNIPGDPLNLRKKAESLEKQIAATTSALEFLSTVEVANLSRQSEVKTVIGEINDLITEHSEGLKLSGTRTDELVTLNDSLVKIVKLINENETYANEARKAGIELTEKTITREEALEEALRRRDERMEQIRLRMEDQKKLLDDQIEAQEELNRLQGVTIPDAPTSGAGGGGATGVGGMFSFPKLFASGGVVNRATSFMTTSGRMGVMGEAGPEAILPLKRGANGQLGVQAGGGSGVVINQSFNFSANGDESVKKIIAEEAPRIAKYTEQQIINSRQRGGHVRRAFN